MEEEPHLLTVLMEKMSAVKQLQTLSEDMSGWLSGSKQLTVKQAHYERISELSSYFIYHMHASDHAAF